MTTHSLESALPTPKPGSPRNAPINDAKRILLQHAPQIAAMQPDALWDDTTQSSVRAAIAALPRHGGNHHTNVGNAIAHVITYGRAAGLWHYTPWAVRVTMPLAESRVRVKDQPHLDRAIANRDRFLDRIPDLLECRERDVLLGALVFSSALNGGLMHAGFLTQIPSVEFHEYDGLQWAELTIGDPTRRVWRNPRRWFPDEVTRTLISRCDPGSPGIAAGTALAKFADWLLIPPYTVEELARAARLWWSTRLPSYLIEYATQPQLAPSVPLLVFKRILTGAPLTRSEARLINPSDAPEADDLDSTTLESRLSTPTPSRDAIQQRNAVKHLMRLLRKQDRRKTPTTQVIERRLQAWESQFGELGGWVWLLQQWVIETISASAGRRKQGLRRPGLVRYLDGFAMRWIAVFHDLPPAEVEDAADEAADRMAALADDLAKMTSASVARTGLARFLQFVRRRTGLDIAMGSEWDDVTTLSEASANLVTPEEFARLQIALRAKLPVDTLPGKRVQAMATLAYATGTRWELLHTLRFKDVFLTSNAQACGVMLRRPNAYVQGKTAPSGGVRLEHVMPLKERVMLRRYVTLSRRLARAEPGDFIFADPRTPHVPPGQELTRDLIQLTLREVTGDPTMRFHHLRHSSANLALIGVAWPRGEVPEVLEHLASFSAQAREITKGSYAELVTNRAHDDRSLLYFVSSVLGHATPSTTMRSYLHTVDAVMAAEVGRQLGLPRRTRAALRGVGAEAIRKMEYRARTRDKTKADAGGHS